MRFSEDVKAVDDLVTSGAQMVRSVAEERRTILLADQGTAKAVLLDIASYGRWRSEPRCERSWKRDETVRQRSDGGWLSDRDAAAVGVE